MHFNILVKIKDAVKESNPFVEQLKCALSQVVSQRIEQQLAADVDRWLYRSHHARRQQAGKRVDDTTVSAVCAASSVHDKGKSAETSRL